MKFRCERDSLIHVVTTAGRAVGSRTSPAHVLNGLRLSCEGNRLQVIGTDLDLTVRITTEAIGISDGISVVPSRLLADIVRALEPGAVTVETTEDAVEISAARSRFSLRTYSPDEFPPLVEPGSPTLHLPTESLFGALRQVVRAASTDDARPLLTGVLITWEEGRLRLVATDSYRLALRDVVADEGSAGMPQILVPGRALLELQRLLAAYATDGDEPASGRIGLAIDDHDITFSLGGVDITTRLLDGTYPDYRQLIPPNYPNALHVGKDSILDALRRVRLLVKDNTTPVRLSMRPGGVDLTVVSHEVGDASETVDADFTGEDLTVAFNPNYLIDGIDAIRGDEVILQTVDGTKPATVRAAEESDFQYLLMPVRVS